MAFITEKSRQTDVAAQAARAYGASEQTIEAYREKMRHIEQELQSIRKRCWLFAFAVAGIIALQAEFLLIPVRNSYAFSSMPLIVEIVYHAMDMICHFWYIPLIVFVAAEIYLKKKRPKFWQRLLLEVPVIGSLLGALYFCRYFFTTSFLLEAGAEASESQRIARDVTGNELCFQNTDEDTDDNEGKASPDNLVFPPYNRMDRTLIATTRLSQMNGHITANEHSVVAAYAKSVFEDACYDTKESAAMAAIFIASIMTIISLMAFISFR